MRKNKNWGYQKLRVWNDAIEYYQLTFRVFRKFSYESKRVAGQAIACSDSVHSGMLKPTKPLLGTCHAKATQ